MMPAELTITAIGAKGDGLALHEGQRLHVPYALPGERIEAEIEGERARLLRVLEPSPERIAPECAHFGTCGGCALQHWRHEAVLEFKRKRVETALRREGLEAPVAPCRDVHGAGRRRVTLHLRRKEGASLAGFMRARSHELIDLDACPLLVPELATAATLGRAVGEVLRGLSKPLDLQVTATSVGLDADLRGAGPVPEPLRQKLIALALQFDLARLSLHGERLVEARVPHITMGALKAFLPTGSFLQATAEAEAALAEAAIVGLKGAKHVADLFCGLGPFILRIARDMKVAGYDSDKPAIEALSRSLKANPGGKPALAEARDLFRRPLFAPELKAFDAVLLDPPRQGAEAQVREIAKSKLGRVVYVSCDPESFARDAGLLVAAGFRLESVSPFDQFRHSAHVELVAVLKR